MKTVAYKGPRDVIVDEVGDANIEKDADALVKLASSHVCRSGLQMDEVHERRDGCSG